MKIEFLKICNWRSIKNLEVKFQDLMIFIGQNNHGKSNVLSAILYFFGEIRHQDLDFNRGANELFVEITFSDLDDSDKTTFRKYLDEKNQITVRKTAYIGGNFEYRGFLRNPVEDWLKESNAANFTTREVASSLPFHPIFQALAESPSKTLRMRRANLLRKISIP